MSLLSHSKEEAALLLRLIDYAFRDGGDEFVMLAKNSSRDNIAADQQGILK